MLESIASFFSWLGYIFTVKNLPTLGREIWDAGKRWNHSRKDKKKVKVSQCANEIAVCLNRLLIDIRNIEGNERVFIETFMLKSIIDLIIQTVLKDVKVGIFPLMVLDENKEIYSEIAVFYFRRETKDMEYRMELMYFSREELDISKNSENVKNLPDDVKKIFFEKIMNKVVIELEKRGVSLTREELRILYKQKFHS